MKTRCIILIFLSLLSISEIKSIAYADAAVDKESVWRTDEEVRAIYEEWMLEHGKVYNGLGEKKLERFEIFKNNLKYIEEHNCLLNQTYKLGLNQFSDLTLDEFESIYLSSSPIDTLDESESDFSYLPAEVNYSIPLPDSVDWRKQDAVLPVKNQGRCGSCWAFSTIASVESLNKIRGGDLISLSEQMLVDCVTSSHGCNGGRQTDAFRYMADHGIASGDDYKYQAVQGPSCQNKKVVLKIDGHKRIVPRREKYLQITTSRQVVCVSIKAKSKDFQHYRSGIFYGNCGDKISHGVNVVGYGSENGHDYWIVRNSWGEKWGEQGYIRMPRNVKQPEGYCGIAIRPTYPIMNPKDERIIRII